MSKVLDYNGLTHYHEQLNKHIPGIVVDNAKNLLSLTPIESNSELFTIRPTAGTASISTGESKLKSLINKNDGELQISYTQQVANADYYIDNSGSDGLFIDDNKQYIDFRGWVEYCSPTQDNTITITWPDTTLTYGVTVETDVEVRINGHLMDDFNYYLQLRASSQRYRYIRLFVRESYYNLQLNTDWAPLVMEAGEDPKTLAAGSASTTFQIKPSYRESWSSGNPLPTVDEPTYIRLKEIGYNQYNHSTGKARVVKDYKYNVEGTFTSLEFSTDNSTWTPLSTSRQVINGYIAENCFTPANNGYVRVTGGNNTDTMICLVHSGYNIGSIYQPYQETVIELPLEDINGNPLPFKYCYEGVEYEYEDETTFEQGIVQPGYDLVNNTFTYTGITMEPWSDSAIIDILLDNNNYAYTDGTNILYKPDRQDGKKVVEIEPISSFIANDFGTEIFECDESTFNNISFQYQDNLVDKLRTDVLTLSEQELTPEQITIINKKINAKETLSNQLYDPQWWEDHLFEIQNDNYSEKHLRDIYVGYGGSIPYGSGSVKYHDNNGNEQYGPGIIFVSSKADGQNVIYTVSGQAYDISSQEVFEADKDFGLSQVYETFKYTGRGQTLEDVYSTASYGYFKFPIKSQWGNISAYKYELYPLYKLFNYNYDYGKFPLTTFYDGTSYPQLDYRIYSDIKRELITHTFNNVDKLAYVFYLYSVKGKKVYRDILYWSTSSFDNFKNGFGTYNWSYLSLGNDDIDSEWDEEGTEITGRVIEYGDILLPGHLIEAREAIRFIAPEYEINNKVFTFETTNVQADLDAECDIFSELVIDGTHIYLLWAKHSWITDQWTNGYETIK